jgi:protoporphyrinogen oxidase
MKSIAIVGAGVSGLTLAYRLVKNNYKVTLYEQNNEVGGQLYAFPIEGQNTDIYYHHTFMSDHNLIELCKELNIYDKLQWLDTSMAYYTEQKLFAFGTPFDLLKFSPLNFVNKVKFVISILRLQNMSKIEEVEKYTAKEWFEKNGYYKIWEIIWEPLFKLKFAEIADDISLVWLWDKLIKRGKSRSGSKEQLCYMEDSFYTLAISLKENIEKLGGKIILNTKVNSIINENNKFKVYTDDNIIDVDTVVSTLSTKNHKQLYNFSDTYNQYLGKYKYQSAICALLVLENNFSDFYWTNVGDYNLPFGGVIEHTNFVSKNNYNGKTILYLSRYLNKDNEFYMQSDDDILNEFYNGLKIINSSFNTSDIIESYIFKQDDAQPIVTKGYEVPRRTTEIDNLYWISTHHVYPHDRGIEYGIEEANNLYEYIKDNNE